MLSSGLTITAAGRLIAQDGSKLGEIVDTSSVTGWDVVVASALIVISFPLSKAVAWIVGKALRKVKMPEEVRPLIRRLTRATVMIVMFAVAMSLVGVSVAWFTVVLAAVLLVAVLMLRPLVENFSAGLLLEVRSPFVVDDEIETNGHEGTVEEVSGRTTVLRTRDGRRVNVPSTDVLNNSITVYTAYASRRSSITLEIAYDADLDTAEKELVAAASSAEGVLDDPPPSVRARGFDSGTYVLELRWWHGSGLADESQALDRVVRNVKKRLDAAGIAMPAPERIVRQPDLPHD
jgi:small-conductance mechanosensitive channel